MVILAVIKSDQKEEIVGLGQYWINESAHTAEVGLVIPDEHQNRGIGTEILTYLTYLARKQGLLGFTAEVLLENSPMLHLFEKMGFDMEKEFEGGICELKMLFREGIS
jgi:RimJ/RimL family protein N-acetyltransferase